jgi:hypothetical protein
MLSICHLGKAFFEFSDFWSCAKAAGEVAAAHDFNDRLNFFFANSGEINRYQRLRLRMENNA